MTITTTASSHSDPRSLTITLMSLLLPIRVFDGMIESGLAPDEVSFSTAIHACGRAGQWQKALSLLHAMEANQVRASTTRTSRFSSGPDPLSHPAISVLVCVVVGG